MWKWLEQWYYGTTKVHENSPNSSVVILGVYTEYHWTARIARTLVSFYRAHWQWLWATAIGAASLWVAVLSLK
jgi:hypothetical protein